MKRITNQRVNSEYFRWLREIGIMAKLRLNGRHRSIPKKSKKILIINNALIGDSIASLPAIKCLIDYTDAEMDMVVSPVFEPLAEHIKGIKRIFVAKSVFRRETEKTHYNNGQYSNYDFVLVMRISEEAYQLLKHVRYKMIKTSLGPYIKYAFHVAKNTVKREQIKQLEDFNLELIHEVGLNKHRIDFDDIFEFRKQDYEKIRQLPFVNNSSKKVVIHTGSGWRVKLWKTDRWVELLTRMNELGDFKFIFVGGTDKEEETFRKIRKKLHFKVYSVIKKMNLKDTALMMKLCDYFIGVDSGPRHIAHLLTLPSICLMGPGPKIFSPKNRNAIIIDKSNCYCTNLFCYRAKSCVERITPNEVLAEFKKLIKR
jgi:ADP-heptose:LPS heptosyltransferase